MFFFFFLCLESIAAQQLTALNAEWNNDYTSWVLGIGEKENGEIRMRWPLNKDWTDWNINIADQYGRLKLRWKENPEEWELSMPDGSFVQIRTTWRGSLNSWVIQQDQKKIIIQTVYNNSYESWETPNEKYGYFGLYTTFEGDLEEWTLVDEMKEEIALSTKAAMAFICILHSIPR